MNYNKPRSLEETHSEFKEEIELRLADLIILVKAYNKEMGDGLARAKKASSKVKNIYGED